MPLISSKDLDKAPVRCQRLLLRLMPFNADVRYVTGKSLIFADALSRSPLPYTAENEDGAEEVFAYVEAIKAGLPIQNRHLEALRAATVHGVNLQFVINCVLNGWPLNRSNIPARLMGINKPKEHYLSCMGCWYSKIELWCWSCAEMKFCQTCMRVIKATQNARRTQIVVYGGPD